MTQVFVFLLPILSQGQTPVIASKYSGNSLIESSIRRDETFGLPPRVVDSFIRISRDSMVEISHFIGPQRDTFRIDEHPLFGKRYKIDKLRKKYPGIVFHNFEKFNSKSKKQSESIEQSGTWSDYWFFIIAAILFVVLFNRFLLNFARQSTNYPVS